MWLYLNHVLYVDDPSVKTFTSSYAGMDIQMYDITAKFENNFHFSQPYYLTYIKAGTNDYDIYLYEKQHIYPFLYNSLSVYLITER